VRRTFAFYDLSNEEFEDLVGHICSEILGTGTIVFATGSDGGRDATFEGCAQKFPSSNSPLSGKFVVQAKHTNNPVASCSDRSFARLIDFEKPKVMRLVINNELDHYLVFTNRKKPADKTIAKEKELKKLVPQTAHIFGNDQLRLWLTKHPKIWSNLGFDRFEKKFDIQPNDLTEVVTAFHRAMKDGDTQFESAVDFTFIDKRRKNKINRLSKDYFQYMQDHSLQHFKAIESFLKNPRNEELRNLYHDTADEIKRKIIVHRELFDSFDEALCFVSDIILAANEHLKGKRSYVTTFLHYMYYTCDIGQHDHTL
jgi:hypothetical protein